MDLVGFGFGLGVFQGLILALVLLAARSSHRQANVFMAAMVLLISLELLRLLLLRITPTPDQTVATFLLYPLSYCWGPLFYLYAISLTGGRLNYRLLLHFVPALLLLLSTSFSYWYLQEQQLAGLVKSAQLDWANSGVIDEVTDSGLVAFWRLLSSYQLVGLFFMLHFSLYCLLVLARIGYHNRRLQQHFSSMESMNLRWLRLLTLACLVYLVIFLLSNRVPRMLGEVVDINSTFNRMSSLFLVLLIYGIAFGALFQPSLVSGLLQVSQSEPRWLRARSSDAFDGDTPAPNEAIPNEAGAVPIEALPASKEETSEVDADAERSSKYQRSTLTMDDIQRYQIQLMKVMQDEQLYLDCDLTLPALANATGISAPQISQVLNGRLDQNFFTFVNGYRVQLAQRMLLDAKTSTMPIVELAVEVGFKSKSSFYDAFKRATNMTPTQFKKAAQNPI